jgi:hypothetical protein
MVYFIDNYNKLWEYSSEKKEARVVLAMNSGRSYINRKFIPMPISLLIKLIKTYNLRYISENKARALLGLCVSRV